MTFTIPDVPDSNGATFRTNMNNNFDSISDYFNDTLKGNNALYNDIVYISTVNIQTASYQLQASDNLIMVGMNSSTAVNVTIPNTLPVGFSTTVKQLGTGQVTFVGDGLDTIVEPDAKYHTAKQYASVTVSIPVTDLVCLDGYTS